jgi:hypothetical protein
MHEYISIFEGFTVITNSNVMRFPAYRLRSCTVHAIGKQSSIHISKVPGQLFVTFAKPAIETYRLSRLD